MRSQYMVADHVKATTPPPKREPVPNVTVGLSIQQESILYRSARRRKY